MTALPTLRGSTLRASTLRGPTLRAPARPRPFRRAGGGAWQDRSRLAMACGAASALAWGWLLLAHQPQLHAHADPGSATWWSVTAAGIGAWTVMVVAMMWPLTVSTLTNVRRATFPRLRPLIVPVTLLAATAVWVLPGVVLTALLVSTGWSEHTLWWAPAWLVVAAGTSWWPTRRRLLSRCEPPRILPPGGVAAVRGAIRAGVRFGSRCGLLCAPVMLAMATHQPVVMLLGTAGVWWEQTHPRRLRDPLPPALYLLAGLASLAAAVA